jgi:hypothetical protein
MKQVALGSTTIFSGKNVTASAVFCFIYLLIVHGSLELMHERAASKHNKEWDKHR